MSGRTAERLRDLASAMGEQIRPQDVRPLRLDASDGQADDVLGPARRRWHGGRWLIPVAAAAAVLALVISVSAAAGILGRAHHEQRPVQKLPKITPLTGTPQFLVTSSEGRGLVYSIHGAMIAKIVAPVRHFLIEGIAAAPGDRIFYLAGVSFDTVASERLEFYRVVLNSKGKPGPARQVAGPPVDLPVPITSDALSAVAVAVSPDGTELAFSPATQLMPDPGTRQPSITVRNLRTGASRTWSTWPSTGTQIGQLSWGDGGQLSVVATIDQGAVACDSVVYHGGTEVNGILELNTRAAGTSLMKDSRLIVSAAASGPSAGLPPAADGPVAGVVTSDGRTFVAQVARHGVSRLVEISAATGKITKVLVSGKRAALADPAVIDGDNLLFTLGPKHVRRTALYVCGHLALAKVSTGRYIILPFPVSCSTAAPPPVVIASW